MQCLSGKRQRSSAPMFNFVCITYVSKTSIQLNRDVTRARLTSRSHRRCRHLETALHRGCISSVHKVLAHLSKSNSRTFQGPYEEYIRRTKSKQTGTSFISISRQSAPQIQLQGLEERCELPQRGVRGRAPATNAFLWHYRAQ